MGAKHSSEEAWERESRTDLCWEQVQEGLAHAVDFSWAQIKQLHQRFRLLSGDQPELRPEGFDGVPDLASNPLRARIVHAFFDNRNLGKGSCGVSEAITFQDFLGIIAYFRPSLEQAEAPRRDKMRFLFHLYDQDGDGLITLQEYRRVLEDLLSAANPQEDRASVRAMATNVAGGALREAARASERPPGDGEPYPGIAFEDFVRTWRGIDLEVKMQVSFLNLEALCK
ncbi:calcineurin B homologous protein 3-like [Psammomys obesus]|uniref:calcineurin B homologous protein 3-like n=1 Tax=Psammomys obesus TaxID=48139 RepID=UPI00245320E2|nr:calcineurin B homologous protein 3-like [Psammomys obesus]